ncbi:MAG TPA: hypothetical protein VF074_14370 [Pyrinomonadaceae bacterium]
MKVKKVIMSAVVLAVATTFLQIKTSAAVQDSLSGRTITGTVYFVGGRASGRSLPFTLIINRLTTPDEITQLNETLRSGGQDDLLRVLSRMKAGRIQVGSGVGLTANAIFTSSYEGRTKLTVLYERNVRFGELRYGARSSDYRFGYAEMFLGRGSNQGMFIPAAKIRLRDGNTWEVEDFGTFPARLMGLRVRGRGDIG